MEQLVVFALSVFTAFGFYALLAWGPEIIVLDEPAAGLSHEESLDLARLLRSITAETGATLVVIEHDMEIVRELADRVVVLAGGRFLAEGGLDEISQRDDVKRAYLGGTS